MPARFSFRFTLLLMVGAFFATITSPPAHAQPNDSNRPPNVILIVADDMGYGDLGCFGSKTIDTPHIDRMANEGVKLTSFYAAAPVCSASRAAMLTGRYPVRTGVTGVLDHDSKSGLPPGEVTIAELLKKQGYATACFGKWHLGHTKRHAPKSQGFDQFFGTPYSHDMWPFHPHNPGAYPPLPLLENDRVVQLNPDPAIYTAACTDRAIGFIQKNKGKPFFLYLPYHMPHVPLGVSEAFKGKSQAGLYGDAVTELDHHVGRLLETLRRLNLERDTIVFFTSDNGPWLAYGSHAGSTGPLRGGKGSTWEGGMRVPAVAWAPGRFAAGRTIDAITTSMDLLPTIAHLAGAMRPDDRVIDGRNIHTLLAASKSAQAPAPANRDATGDATAGKVATDEPGQVENASAEASDKPADASAPFTSPHEAFFYFRGDRLQAVRAGAWKLHVNLVKPSAEEPARLEAVALYHLGDDVGESNDVGAAQPEVVKQLLIRAEALLKSLE